MDEYRRLLEKSLINDQDRLKLLLVEDVPFSKNAEASEKARECGNELYRQKHHSTETHREIFKYYCQSIACAPLQSEQFALALGNRSAFLLHIRKYEEAIRDIDTAVKVTKSCALKAKLLSRKTECRKNLGLLECQQDIDEIGKCIDKVTNDKSKSPLIKRLEHVQALPVVENPTLDNENKHKKISLPKIDNILERIEIRQNEKYGRYTVAARDYKPGEIIYIEDLYATAIFPTRTYISCHYCLKTAWSGVPCGECNWAMFCSEVCKQKAWIEFHDIECSVIPYLRSNTDSIISDISLRLLVLGLKESGSVAQLRDELKTVDACTDPVRQGFYKDGTLTSRSISSIYNLKGDGHHTTYVDNIVQSVPPILIALVKCGRLQEHFTVESLNDLVDEDDLMFLGSLLVKFTVIYMLNAYGYYSYHDCEISNLPEVCSMELCCHRATSLAPFASLINHSCFPNASRCFTDDRKIIFYALHPIKEEFTAHERREKLWYNYCFECDCQACTELWPVLDMENIFLITPEQKKLFQIYDYVKSRIDDKSIESKAITKAFKSFRQPYNLTCVLIKKLMLYYRKTASLQPESFGNCSESGLCQKQDQQK